MSLSWTEADIEALRVLAMMPERFSQLELAAQLNRTRGGTASAISRYKIPHMNAKTNNQYTTDRPKTTRKNKRNNYNFVGCARTVAKPRPFTPRNAEVEPKHLDLMQLGPHECRFPFGGDNGAPITFCGHHAEDGPYCMAHARLCGAGYRVEHSVQRQKQSGSLP